MEAPALHSTLIPLQLFLDYVKKKKNATSYVEHCIMYKFVKTLQSCTPETVCQLHFI